MISLIETLRGKLTPPHFAAYGAAQVCGALVGAMLANLMFSLPAVDPSTRTRGGGGVWLAEVAATFGLILVVVGASRSGRRTVTALAVGTYIAAAHFFTSSTSFANPAVTLGRTISDTFAGIAPSSAPAFIVAQVLGAMLGLLAVHSVFPPTDPVPETTPFRESQTTG